MAANDVITLAEAKAAINLDVSETTHDTELAQKITAASGWMDAACGPVVIRTVTEWRDGDTEPWLAPFETPVSAFTSVTEYQATTATVLTAETESTQPASGYLLLGEGHDLRVYRRAGGSDTLFPSGSRRVKLVYGAGRYANTASVDARFKEACSILLHQLWRGTVPAWAGSADWFDAAGRNVPWRLPPAVAALLLGEVRPGVEGGAPLVG